MKEQEVIHEISQILHIYPRQIEIALGMSITLKNYTKNLNQLKHEFKVERQFRQGSELELELYLHILEEINMESNDELKWLSENKPATYYKKGNGEISTSFESIGRISKVIIAFNTSKNDDERILIIRRLKEILEK